MVLKWSLSNVKHHPALIPLFLFLGLGVGGAIFYPLRLAFRNPEVCWDRKNNPEPWNEYADKQYKFYSATMDYSKIKSQAPKY